jgi:hypothetical protein
LGGLATGPGRPERAPSRPSFAKDLERRLVAVLALLFSACAQGGKVARHTDVGRNEPALARALAWIIDAAPAAARYGIELGGAPPSAALLREAAAASGLSIVGAELRRPPSTTPLAERVSLKASRPVWADPREASIEIRYQVEGQAEVPCVVKVRPPSTASRDWAVTSPSGAECQRAARR